MSIEGLNWALAQEGLSSTQKFVLVILGNYADPYGQCYPSQTRIAKLTGLERRAVCTALQALETAGLIRRTGRRNTHGAVTSDITELLCDRRSSSDCVIDDHAPCDLRSHDPKEDPKESLYIGFDPFSRTTHSNGHSNTKIRGRKNTSDSHTWPEDFKLDPEMRAYALSKGVADPEAEFDGFHDWALARAAAYVDWRAGWRTRCNHYREFHKNGNGNGREDRRARASERWDQEVEEARIDGIRRWEEKKQRESNSAGAKDAARPGSGAVGPGRIAT